MNIDNTKDLIDIIETFLIEECNYSKYDQLSLNSSIEKIIEILENDFEAFKKVSEEDLKEQFYCRRESLIDSFNE